MCCRQKIFQGQYKMYCVCIIFKKHKIPKSLFLILSEVKLIIIVIFNLIINVAHSLFVVFSQHMSALLIFSKTFFSMSLSTD